MLPGNTDYRFKTRCGRLPQGGDERAQLDRFRSCPENDQNACREISWKGERLLVAVGDVSLCEVIRRHLKSDTITSENSNTVTSEFASQMSENRSILI